ncbi:MAG TPA: MarR family transcriptional regulator [Solirubrobacteraceae bacterium]|jgi:DNA-binding MarR family transcriptional regulator|nr:MarR family transcriptional regulator [Solirubrobacteraceae bacterium]
MMGDERWAAWYCQAKMNARLTERIADEMERRTGLNAAWCEVLANLEEEPKRMNELADDLILSRGGATRLIARMEDAGLVERQTPSYDRRATFAVITEAGREAIERAFPVHLEVVEEVFARHIDDSDAETVLRVAEKICDAHGWPAKPRAETAT